jgi:hypothetical protein
VAAEEVLAERLHLVKVTLVVMDSMVVFGVVQVVAALEPQVLLGLAMDLPLAALGHQHTQHY